MVDILKKLFFISYTKETQRDDFADFFLRAKSREKKAFFKKVIREANSDQRKYLQVYEEMSSANK